MTRKEEIEEAALNYGYNNPNGHLNADAEYEEDYETPSHDFTAGAEWADEHPIHYNTMLEEFEKNRLNHCDSITKEQYDLESGFVTRHLEKNHRIPTFLDAIEYGIEKAREEMLDEALESYCKVCDHFAHDVPTYICRLDCPYYKDFRKAMKK